MTTPDATAKAGHTKLPWKILDDSNWDISVRQDNGGPVALCQFGGIQRDLAKANARLIVEAVNSAPALRARVEELEGALSICLDELRHICSVGDRPITRGIAIGQSVLYGGTAHESK